MFHVERLKNIISCPVCGASEFSLLLTCKDFTVSKDEFEIKICRTCEFALTSPRPEENELGRYYDSPEYISHSNTKKGLLSKVYQAVRKRTLKGKLKLISHHAKQGRLLDIGCGTGEFLSVCQADGWNVVGIEPSENARQQGKANYKLDVRPEENLSVLPNASFDLITMWHVLEHVPHLNERIQEIRRLLKLDGLLIIAVPNRNSHEDRKSTRLNSSHHS